jgi:hypothetical protein
LSTRTLGLGRDEVVYLSQVSGFAEPAFFSAPRARGITWLVAPIAQISDDPVVIRGYLAALSGLALALAYWPWLRVRGVRSPAVAPLAAGLLASVWLSRFYATQVMPNLWIAFGAVGALGLMLRLAEPGGFRWWRLVVLGLAVAFVAAIRPSDAGVLVGVLIATSLLTMRGVRRRRGFQAALGVGLGGLLGLSPWVVESYQRFGGVGARLHQAAYTEGEVSFGFNLGMNLRVMDGPILCRPTCKASRGPLPVDAIAMCGLCAALIAFAIVLAWRWGQVSAALAPAAGAIAMAGPYLVGVGYAAPRFMLPTYALSALPIALALAGLVWLTPGRWKILTGAVLLTAFGFYLANQQAVFARVHHGQDTKRDRILLIAEFLTSKGVKPPCVVSGSTAPQIAHALGCSSSALGGHDASITRQQLLDLSKNAQVVLTRGAPNLSTKPPSWAGDGWIGYRVPGLPKKWALTVFVPTPTPTTPNPSQSANPAGP